MEPLQNIQGGGEGDGVTTGNDIQQASVPSSLSPQTGTGDSIAGFNFGGGLEQASQPQENSQNFPLVNTQEDPFVTPSLYRDIDSKLQTDNLSIPPKELMSNNDLKALDALSNHYNKQSSLGNVQFSVPQSDNNILGAVTTPDNIVKDYQSIYGEESGDKDLFEGASNYTPEKATIKQFEFLNNATSNRDELDSAMESYFSNEASMQEFTKNFIRRYGNNFDESLLAKEQSYVFDSFAYTKMQEAGVTPAISDDLSTKYDSELPQLLKSYKYVNGSSKEKRALLINYTQASYRNVGRNKNIDARELIRDVESSGLIYPNLTLLTAKREGLRVLYDIEKNKPDVAKLRFLPAGVYVTSPDKEVELQKLQKKLDDLNAYHETNYTLEDVSSITAYVDQSKSYLTAGSPLQMLTYESSAYDKKGVIKDQEFLDDWYYDSPELRLAEKTARIISDLDVEKETGWWKTGAEAFGHGWYKSIPVVGSSLSTEDKKILDSVYKKLRNNEKLSPDEQLLADATGLKNYIAAVGEQRSSWEVGFTMLPYSLSFAAELIASGGITYSAPKAALTKSLSVAAAIAEGSLTKAAVLGIGRKTLTYLGVEGAQKWTDNAVYGFTSVSAAYIQAAAIRSDDAALGIMERMVPSNSYYFDGASEAYFDELSMINGQGLFEATLKEYIGQGLEIMTERLGEKVIKSALYNEFFEKTATLSSASATQLGRAMGMTPEAVIRFKDVMKTSYLGRQFYNDIANKADDFVPVAGKFERAYVASVLADYGAEGAKLLDRAHIQNPFIEYMEEFVANRITPFVEATEVGGNDDKKALVRLEGFYDRFYSDPVNTTKDEFLTTLYTILPIVAGPTMLSLPVRASQVFYGRQEYADMQALKRSVNAMTLSTREEFLENKDRIYTEAMANSEGVSKHPAMLSELFESRVSFENGEQPGFNSFKDYNRAVAADSKVNKKITTALSDGKDINDLEKTLQTKKGKEQLASIKEMHTNYESKKDSNKETFGSFLNYAAKQYKDGLTIFEKLTYSIDNPHMPINYAVLEKGIASLPVSDNEKSNLNKLLEDAKKARQVLLAKNLIMPDSPEARRFLNTSGGGVSLKANPKDKRKTALFVSGVPYDKEMHSKRVAKSITRTLANASLEEINMWFHKMHDAFQEDTNIDAETKSIISDIFNSRLNELFDSQADVLHASTAGSIITIASMIDSLLRNGHLNESKAKEFQNKYRDLLRKSIAYDKSNSALADYFTLTQNLYPFSRLMPLQILNPLLREAMFGVEVKENKQAPGSDVKTIFDAIKNKVKNLPVERLAKFSDLLVDNLTAQQLEVALEKIARAKISDKAEELKFKMFVRYLFTTFPETYLNFSIEANANSGVSEYFPHDNRIEIGYRDKTVDEIIFNITEEFMHAVNRQVALQLLGYLDPNGIIPNGIASAMALTENDVNRILGMKQKDAISLAAKFWKSKTTSSSDRKLYDSATAKKRNDEPLTQEEAAFLKKFNYEYNSLRARLNAQNESSLTHNHGLSPELLIDNWGRYMFFRTPNAKTGVVYSSTDALYYASNFAEFFARNLADFMIGSLISEQIQDPATLNLFEKVKTYIIKNFISKIFIKYAKTKDKSGTEYVDSDQFVSDFLGRQITKEDHKQLAEIYKSLVDNGNTPGGTVKMFGFTLDKEGLIAKVDRTTSFKASNAYDLESRWSQAVSSNQSYDKVNELFKAAKLNKVENYILKDIFLNLDPDLIDVPRYLIVENDPSVRSIDTLGSSFLTKMTSLASKNNFKNSRELVYTILHETIHNYHKYNIDAFLGSAKTNNNLEAILDKFIDQTKYTGTEADLSKDGMQELYISVLDFIQEEHSNNNVDLINTLFVGTSKNPPLNKINDINNLDANIINIKNLFQDIRINAALKGSKSLYDMIKDNNLIGFYDLSSLNILKANYETNDNSIWMALYLNKDRFEVIAHLGALALIGDYESNLLVDTFGKTTDTTLKEALQKAASLGIATSANDLENFKNYIQESVLIDSNMSIDTSNIIYLFSRLTDISKLGLNVFTKDNLYNKQRYIPAEYEYWIVEAASNILTRVSPNNTYEELLDELALLSKEDLSEFLWRMSQDMIGVGLNTNSNYERNILFIFMDAFVNDIKNKLNLNTQQELQPILSKSQSYRTNQLNTLKQKSPYEILDTNDTHINYDVFLSRHYFGLTSSVEPTLDGSFRRRLSAVTGLHIQNLRVVEGYDNASSGHMFVFDATKSDGSNIYYATAILTDKLLDFSHRKDHAMFTHSHNPSMSNLYIVPFTNFKFQNGELYDIMTGETYKENQPGTRKNIIGDLSELNLPFNVLTPSFINQPGFFSANSFVTDDLLDRVDPRLVEATEQDVLFYAPALDRTNLGALAKFNYVKLDDDLKSIDPDKAVKEQLARNGFSGVVLNDSDNGKIHGVSLKSANSFDFANNEIVVERYENNGRLGEYYAPFGEGYGGYGKNKVTASIKKDAVIVDVYSSESYLKLNDNEIQNKTLVKKLGTNKWSDAFRKMNEEDYGNAEITDVEEYTKTLYREAQIKIKELVLLDNKNADVIRFKNEDEVNPTQYLILNKKVLTNKAVPFRSANSFDFETNGFTFKSKLLSNIQNHGKDKLKLKDWRKVVGKKDEAVYSGLIEWLDRFGNEEMMLSKQSILNFFDNGDKLRFPLEVEVYSSGERRQVISQEKNKRGEVTPSGSYHRWSASNRDNNVSQATYAYKEVVLSYRGNLKQLEHIGLEPSEVNYLRSLELYQEEVQQDVIKGYRNLYDLVSRYTDYDMSNFPSIIGFDRESYESMDASTFIPYIEAGSERILKLSINHFTESFQREKDHRARLFALEERRLDMFVDFKSHGRNRQEYISILRSLKEKNVALKPLYHFNHYDIYDVVGTYRRSLVVDEIGLEYTPETFVLEEFQSDYAQDVRKKEVRPDAPFVSDTNMWLKQMALMSIQDAAKSGAKTYFFSDGSVHNKRYNLYLSGINELRFVPFSKNINEVEVILFYEDKRTGSIKSTENIGMHTESGVKRLKDLAGEDIYEQIINSQRYQDTIIESKVPKEARDELGEPEWQDGTTLDIQYRPEKKNTPMHKFYGDMGTGDIGFVGNILKSAVKEIAGVDVDIKPFNLFGKNPEVQEGFSGFIFEIPQEVIEEANKAVSFGSANSYTHNAPVSERFGASADGEFDIKSWQELLNLSSDTEITVDHVFQVLDALEEEEGLTNVRFHQRKVVDLWKKYNILRNTKGFAAFTKRDIRSLFASNKPKSLKALKKEVELVNKISNDSKYRASILRSIPLRLKAKRAAMYGMKGNPILFYNLNRLSQINPSFFETSEELEEFNNMLQFDVRNNPISELIDYVNDVNRKYLDYKQSNRSYDDITEDESGEQIKDEAEYELNSRIAEYLSLYVQTTHPDAIDLERFTTLDVSRMDVADLKKYVAALRYFALNGELDHRHTSNLVAIESYAFMEDYLEMTDRVNYDNFNKKTYKNRLLDKWTVDGNIKRYAIRDLVNMLDGISSNYEGILSNELINPLAVNHNKLRWSMEDVIKRLAPPKELQNTTSTRKVGIYALLMQDNPVVVTATLIKSYNEQNPNAQIVSVPEGLLLNYGDVMDQYEQALYDHGNKAMRQDLADSIGLSYFETPADLEFTKAELRNVEHDIMQATGRTKSSVLRLRKDILKEAGYETMAEFTGAIINGSFTLNETEKAWLDSSRSIMKDIADGMYSEGHSLRYVAEVYSGEKYFSVHNYVPIIRYSDFFSAVEERYADDMPDQAGVDNAAKTNAYYRAHTDVHINNRFTQSRKKVIMALNTDLFSMVRTRADQQLFYLINESMNMKLKSTFRHSFWKESEGDEHLNKQGRLLLKQNFATYMNRGMRPPVVALRNNKSFSWLNKLLNNEKVFTVGSPFRAPAQMTTSIIAMQAMQGNMAERVADLMFAYRYVLGAKVTNRILSGTEQYEKLNKFLVENMPDVFYRNLPDFDLDLAQTEMLFGAKISDYRKDSRSGSMIQLAFLLFFDRLAATISAVALYKNGLRAVGKEFDIDNPDADIAKRANDLANETQASDNPLYKPSTLSNITMGSGLELQSEGAVGELINRSNWAFKGFQMQETVRLLKARRKMYDAIIDGDASKFMEGGQEWLINIGAKLAFQYIKNLGSLPLLHLLKYLGDDDRVNSGLRFDLRANVMRTLLDYFTLSPLLQSTFRILAMQAARNLVYHTKSLPYEAKYALAGDNLDPTGFLGDQIASTIEMSKKYGEYVATPGQQVPETAYRNMLFLTMLPILQTTMPRSSGNAFTSYGMLTAQGVMQFMDEVRKRQVQLEKIK